MRFTLALLALSSLATAQPLALLPLEGASESGGVYRQILANLDAAKVKHKGLIAMTLEEARVSFSCFDESPGCMSQIGQIVETKQLSWGRLERVEELWVLSLKTLDVERSELIKEIRLVRVADDEALKALTRAAAGILQGQAAPPGMEGELYVISEPRGAAVQVDGEPRGEAPLLTRAAPGERLLALTLAGHEPLEVKVAMSDRVKRLKLRMTSISGALLEGSDLPALNPKKTPPPPPPPGRSGLFWGGVGAASVAMLGIGAGILYGVEVNAAAKKADEHPSDHPDRAQWNEDFDHARLMSNTGFVTAGLTAALAATLLYLDAGAAE